MTTTLKTVAARQKAIEEAVELDQLAKYNRLTGGNSPAFAPAVKLILMPKEASWWAWLLIATLLAVGLAGVEVGFYAAIALSTAQAGWVLWKHRAWKPYPVQIRVAYTACLCLYLLPGFRWMFWVPMLGTFALVLFGYCLMARLLSLMPWNRSEPLTGELLRRTFFSAPVIGRADHGLPSTGCPGSICELEAQVAQRSPRPALSTGALQPR
jgi:hypothetical protein